MATHVTCHLPTNEFALSETLDTVSDLTLTCERIVALGEKTVTPLVRFRGPDLSAIGPALADDPTVDSFELLTQTANEALCHIQWNNRVCLLVRMLTATDGLVLSGAATAQRWTFRLLFPSRDALSQLDDFCTSHNLSLDVTTVEAWDGNGPDPLGLTADQYEALVTAYQYGYFKVPREIVLDELAVEMDISHQALSERLRRGHDTLIERVLHPGPPEDSQTAADRTETRESLSPSQLSSINLD